MKRIPKNYQGRAPTGRLIQNLLPEILESFEKVFDKHGDLVIDMWPEVIGERLAPMTKAVAFVDGTLKVKVNNSSLLSLLEMHEKKKLIESLRKKLPSIKIINIHFSIG